MITLTINSLGNHRDGAGDLFEALARSEPHFHPHAMTREFAATHAWLNDVYDVMVVEPCSEVIAYGILRGWDAGYKRPSLGIAVAAEYRGRGLGRAMMEHLHCTARLRGATEVRLKVYPENIGAKNLYTSLGYEWLPDLEVGQLVGIKRLGVRL